MILTVIIFIWLGMASLFTFALCSSASRPIPKPRRYVDI